MAPILGIYASQISGHLIPPSSFESIATVTATGGETSLNFTSIPSTYKSLQVRGIMRSTNTGLYDSATGSFWFNGDQTANYSMHYLYGNGTTVTALGYATSSGVGSPYMQNSVPKNGNATTGMFSAWVIDILDYANTNKYKTARILTGCNTNNGTDTKENIALFSALWLNTAAITSLSLSTSTGFVAGSTFALYGIKG